MYPKNGNAPDFDLIRGHRIVKVQYNLLISHKQIWIFHKSKYIKKQCLTGVAQTIVWDPNI
ncbi:MAG: hypothetical protein DRR19_27320 [Candidatus Parabeggiatoa sp. nov. 1]|nr:MAG: hypothetical protein DRR19_27320 [Gammaproteobacteria bacterium]